MESLELLEIAVGLEAEVVIPLPVGAAGQVVRALEALVRVHRQSSSTGPMKPDLVPASRSASSIGTSSSESAPIRFFIFTVFGS